MFKVELQMERSRRGKKVFIVICFDGIVSTFYFVVVFSLFLLKTKNQNNQVAKMAVNGNFNDCINSFSDEVQTTVEDILQNSDRDYLMEIQMTLCLTTEHTIQNDIDLDYKLSQTIMQQTKLSPKLRTTIPTLLISVKNLLLHPPFKCDQFKSSSICRI